MRSKFMIGGVCVVCAAVMWLFTRLYQELLNAYEQSGTLTDLEYSWFFRLLLNLAGYASVMLPGVILFKYLERTNYFDKITNSTWVSRTLFLCFGSHERLPDGAPRKEGGAGAGAGAGDAREGLELMFCFTGLMGAYLVWGLLQEKIMTQKYAMADGSLVRFSDSQFLVFINRLFALALALARLACARTPALVPPLYKFSYCALTNVISAWCQYEALKYVSFPTQVLSKSCKVIPVMLMGALVSRNKYAPYEHATAALISLGMVMFMLGSAAGERADHAGTYEHATAALISLGMVMFMLGSAAGERADHAVWAGTTASGLALLALYMSCDSFTASWQAALFARARCQPLQMLCAVNLFSCLLTAQALLHKRDTATSIALLQHPGFLADCAVLSASSALGQLLIYRTIARFGAVVFTIIMTLRQAVSILLSCAVYGHRVSAAGGAGVALVFAAVLLRVYCHQRGRRRQTREP